MCRPNPRADWTPEQWLELIGDDPDAIEHVDELLSWVEGDVTRMEFWQRMRDAGAVA